MPVSSRRRNTVRRKYSLDQTIVAILEELMLDPARASPRYGAGSGFIEKLLRAEFSKLNIHTLADAQAFRERTARRPVNGTPAPQITDL